jgi:hypothetical protein
MFGLVILLLAVVATGGGGAILNAKSSIKVDAGPDQTVPGSSPRSVVFNGKTNVANGVCNWYNQWGHLRVKDQCQTQFDVNFGKNPRVGTTRTFTLEVTDTTMGERAQDRVTIALGKTKPEPPKLPPCPEPTITASTEVAFPGDKVIVSGEGWIAGRVVKLSLDDGPLSIFLTTVDKVHDSGRWKTTFTVPNEPYGYWLTARQRGSADCYYTWAELPFEVEPLQGDTSH